MSINLDRDVVVDVNLDNGQITKPNNASYYNTDSNIAFFYIKLHKTTDIGVVEYVKKEEANNYEVKMKIVKPKSLNTTIVTSVQSNDLIDENCALYKFTIENSLLKEVGDPFCYVSVAYDNQELTTDGFTYHVKQDPLSKYNLVLLNDPDMPLLLKLIERTQDSHNIDDVNVNGYSTFSSRKIISLLENKADKNHIWGMDNLSQEAKTAINKIPEASEITINDINDNFVSDNVEGALNEAGDKIKGKQDKLVSGTNIKTINGESLLGNGNIAITGGSNIDTSNFATKTELTENLSSKQNTLVSGTNIKTINGESLLGNGNIAITGGSSTGGTTETYGIIADGVTDNSNAIRTALRSTKHLVLPRGKIYLASTIELDSETTITSEGHTEIITNGNPAFSCNGILNESVTPNTVAFKHDITISNLTFTFKSEAETSALRFNSVNNVDINNCTTTNISLITLSTSFRKAEESSTTYDPVAAGGIVNEDCLSNNIRIANNTIYGTNGNTRTVGIVACYCKNLIITGNVIRNAIDGIRIWGANVGAGNYNKDEMEYYCKYITVSNNLVENVVGGIWCSRSAYVTFSGNTVNKCTDVGLDFEGCHSCTATGNVVKDCLNGCMGVMFSAKKISFVGNTCIDTGAMEQGVFLFAHTDNDNMKMDMYVADNTFTSKTRMLGSALLYSRQGSIIIEDNIFNNASLGLGNTTYTRIKGNTFWVDPTLSQDFWIPAKAPVISITSVASEYNPEGVHRYNHEIIGNTFRNSLTTSINDATLENKAINITGSAWRQSMRILIKDNKMTGFPKDLVVNADSGNANNESSIFLELIDNLFSGEIINESSNTFAKLYYEGNKKILTSTTGHVSNSLLSNFPNAIPTATGKATWLKGTKIYFDAPDAGGNIGAICTAGGDPGTWKTFGGAGTINVDGSSIDLSNYVTKGTGNANQIVFGDGVDLQSKLNSGALGNGGSGSSGVSIRSITTYFRASTRSSGVTRDVSTLNNEISTLSTSAGGVTDADYLWPRFVYYDSNRNILGVGGFDNPVQTATVTDILAMAPENTAYFRVSINAKVICSASNGYSLTQKTGGFDAQGNLDTSLSTFTYIENYLTSDILSGGSISWLVNDGSGGNNGGTTDPSGESWTTTPQTINSTKKYLWIYQVFNYTDGSSFSTEPCIIGVYAASGSSGGSSGTTGSVSVSVNNSTYSSVDGVVTLPSYLTIPKNEKITIIGDSITYGYDGTDASLVAKPYPLIIQELLGVTVYNYGMSGSTIGGGGTNATVTGSTPMNIRYVDMVAADYILVLGGVNDYGSSVVPLGAKGDSTNQTFYGSLKILIEGLIAKYPTGKIGFMTPIRKQGDTAPNIQGFTLKQYRDAIIDMCEEYSVPVLDLYMVGGCHANVPAWRSSNLPDGLHPNQAYYHKLAKQIAAFIEAM